MGTHPHLSKHIQHGLTHLSKHIEHGYTSHIYLNILNMGTHPTFI